MKYLTLIGEMAKKQVSHAEIAELLGIHRNSVAYKLNEGSFSVDEAYMIREKLFPEFTIEELFKRQ